MTLGLHSKRQNFVEPADEAIDNLLDFCPWTRGLSSGSIVYEVQGKSTTIKSCKGAVDVLQGNGFLSSLQSASKPVPMNNSKLSISPIAQVAKSSSQGAKSSGKAAEVAPISCRQIWNEVRMKNKWSSPAFKLMNEESMPHIPN